MQCLDISSTDTGYFQLSCESEEDSHKMLDQMVEALRRHPTGLRFEPRVVQIFSCG